ncbi:right-handed parallel beta-helix repeat-containing protein [Microbacterium album]|uniref:Right handed beta helix domain-containing protein n=1 Tax=Microbacterium album TaxID=2053191 RepID=A0A917IFE1_9MICO|nr:right-handed parallel beta-helix repeat-containing protein [Microbacterium album]GGH40878.1 hypothetical protein GCM10010921_13110 [Microbacterium album]
MPRELPPFRRALLAAMTCALTAGLLVGCGAQAPEEAPTVVRVPADAATISEAVAAVAEDGLVLVSPGVYEEEVLIDTPGITLRGLDRDETVVDGGGMRPFGVVAIADGVSVENLTVTGATFYGVLVTGLHDENGPTAHGGDGYSTFDPEQFPPLERFSISHVTAYNNGLYGLYAFNARHGVIRDSYASGSADSGIYVGQCRECDILVTGNVAENNAVGFENANASDSVYVVGNRFSGNRVGMTFLSNYQEAFVPQRGNVVAGNVVSGNAEAESPAHAEGGFGIGIGIGAGTENEFLANRIEDNPVAGVLLSSTEDLAPLGNALRGSLFGGNGVDIANVASDRAPARGTCLDGDAVTTLPEVLASELVAGCAPDATDAAPQTSTASAELPAVDVPPGMSFLRVPAPPSQPGVADPEAPARTLPSTIGAPELGDIAVPDAGLLADRSRR